MSTNSKIPIQKKGEDDDHHHAVSALALSLLLMAS
jgi:hypothetical protein